MYFGEMKFFTACGAAAHGVTAVSKNFKDCFFVLIFKFSYENC